MSFDTPSANKVFKEKFDYPFDLLTDEDREVSIKFGAAEHSSEKAARISVLIGPSGEVVKSYGDVKPANHPEQVLLDLGNT